MEASLNDPDVLREWPSPQMFRLKASSLSSGLLWFGFGSETERLLGEPKLM